MTLYWYLHRKPMDLYIMTLTDLTLILRISEYTAVYLWLFWSTCSMMNLDLHYRDFVVNDREFLFDYAPGFVPSFHDRMGILTALWQLFSIKIQTWRRDPLSSNRRMLDSGGFGHVRHFGGGRTDAAPYWCVDSRHRRPYSGRWGPGWPSACCGTQSGSHDESHLVATSSGSGDLVVREIGGADSRTGPAGLLGRN